MNNLLYGTTFCPTGYWWFRYFVARLKIWWGQL